MLFLIEKKEKEDIEEFIVKNLIKKEKYLHQYVELSLDDFYFKNKLLNKDNFPKEYKNAIPVGDIPFVTAWLNIFKGIKKQNPIEIPNILRTDEFLKRKYSIVTSDKIPTSGNYFIKDVSELKSFSYIGDLEYLINDEIFNKPKEFDASLHLNKDHLFQISEVVDILSEYRVYIIDNKIQAIEYYDGDPTIFPDIQLIQKANLLYSTQKDCPKSYSLDVMVNKKGTSIIEIHNFSSLGLYSNVWGTNLLYAYIDGIDYTVNHNTKIETFSNF